MGRKHSPEKWAVKWSRQVRLAIVETATDRAHAERWVWDQVRASERSAAEPGASTDTAERNLAYAALMRAQVIPRLNEWLAGTWEPEEPEA